MKITRELCSYGKGKSRIFRICAMLLSDLKWKQRVSHLGSCKSFENSTQIILMTSKTGKIIHKIKFLALFSSFANFYPRQALWTWACICEICERKAFSSATWKIENLREDELPFGQWRHHHPMGDFRQSCCASCVGVSPVKSTYRCITKGRVRPEATRWDFEQQRFIEKEINFPAEYFEGKPFAGWTNEYNLYPQLVSSIWNHSTWWLSLITHK